MNALSRHIAVDAPADAVWEVIADRFDRIGDWATAIASSTATAGDPRLVPAAPVSARMCDTGIRALPRVTETVVAFDRAARTLAYQATAGMPVFVTVARNTWTVTDLGVGRCRVDIAAEFITRGMLGRIARPLILARVLRDGQHLLDDLKHFVEHGTPSPRKQSRQRRRPAIQK